MANFECICIAYVEYSNTQSLHIKAISQVSKNEKKKQRKTAGRDMTIAVDVKIHCKTWTVKAKLPSLVMQ